VKVNNLIRNTVGAALLIPSGGLAQAEPPNRACHSKCCSGAICPTRQATAGEHPALDQILSHGNRLPRPEDILKDGEQERVVNGVRLRMGTIGAFMQNARVFSSPTGAPAEKAAARKALVDYAPTIVAIGFDRQVTWKDPEVARIIASVRSRGAEAPCPQVAPGDGQELGKRAVSPRDLLQDQATHFIRNGIRIRKGSIACFTVNAATFASPRDLREKEAARAHLVEFAPALVALDVDRVVTWKDAEAQKILDQARRRLELGPSIT
jgi:hypothetical protein